MTTLIAYGTVEGQTRKIAKFVEQQLRDAGEDTRLFDTNEEAEDLALTGFDKVVFAASVHERRHPKAFEAFVAGSRDELASIPTLLLSISLKAAFEEGWEEAQAFCDEMKLRTGLTPTMELLVPGAIRSESYDAYASQVMRHVVLAGQHFDPSLRDHEFTDWDVLRTTVDRFLSGETSELQDKAGT